ncbi:MAG: hypothetical protein ABSF23_01940 [Terracidiphilus sp.]
MPRELPAETDSAQADAGGQARLCEDLGNGLHAMAQPLAVLRGALGALAMRGRVAADSGRYLEMSIQQVERLCSTMNRLSGLLDAHQSGAARTKVNLCELIGSLLESDGFIPRESGVRIAAARPGRHVHVAGDPVRTEQAIRAALTAAMALASHGDVLHVGVAPGDGFAHLTVENRNSRGRTLNSSDRLQLSLAEANIRSQQGLYECVEDPFRVSIKLPLHDEQGPDTKTLPDRTSLQGIDHNLLTECGPLES